MPNAHTEGAGRQLYFSGEAGTEVGCGTDEARQRGHRCRFFLLEI
jgi:hypothetical protein